MKKSENLIKTISASNAALAPNKFFSVLGRGLHLRILPVMGKVHDVRLHRFARNLYAISLHIQRERERLDHAQKNKKGIRETRQKLGRTKAATKNSVESLLKAENIGSTIKGLNPLNFAPARKELERLGKKIGNSESFAAGLIHPSLRTGDEKRRVKQMRREPSHPPYKATPGSRGPMHRAIEMLEDEIQTFTRGKVQPGQVNKFIAEFLLTFFGWTVAVENVKTVRARYSEGKREDHTANSSST